MAVEQRWAAELELGGHLAAIGQLQRLVVDHPFRERLQGLLLLALHRSGRRTEALRAYQIAVGALAEVGLDPGPALRSLERRIAAHDVTLDHAGQPSRLAAPQQASIAPVPIVEPGAAPRPADSAASRRAGPGLEDDVGVEVDVEVGVPVERHRAERSTHSTSPWSTPPAPATRRWPGATRTDAIAQYRLALAALDLGGSSRPRRRVSSCCSAALGPATSATSSDDALVMFRTAARAAASLGDVGLLNEAATGLALATEFAMADDGDRRSARRRVAPRATRLRAARRAARRPGADDASGRPAEQVARGRRGRAGAPRSVTRAASRSRSRPGCWSPGARATRSADSRSSTR